MGRTFFIFFCAVVGLMGGLSSAWAEADIRYLSAEELQQQNKQKAQRRSAQKRKAEAIKQARRNKSQALARQKAQGVGKRQPPKRRPRVEDVSSRISQARQNNRDSNARKAVVNRQPALASAPRIVVRDTLERLEEALPKKRTEIIKALDVVDHIRTYYTINRGADLTDLQKDTRFKEIYEDMDKETQKMTYLYLKGLYENSPQAITDKNDKGAKSLAELPLNRKYMPSKTDIDGFNEKTSVKSKLVRSLSGKYVRTAKPRAESSSAASEDADGID